MMHAPLAVMNNAVMNNVQIIKTIKALIHNGDRAKDKSEQLYIAAGQHLKTLKERGAHKDLGMTWEDYVDKECGIKKSRAYELMQIADGRTTVEGVRALTAKRTRKTRAQKRPLRSGQKPAATDRDPIQEDCEDCNDDQERWQRSLGNFAGDAVTIRAFWDRLFGKGWRQFEIPSSHVTLAQRAAEEWSQIASELAKQKGVNDGKGT